MPSSTQEAARLAADRVKNDRGVDLKVALGRGDIACKGDLAPHVEALSRLFALCVDLAGPAAQVVLRPDPLGWLHVRGEGIPRMGEGLAATPFREAVAIGEALGGVDAYLVLDAGGFLVIYGKTASATGGSAEGGDGAAQPQH